MDGTLAVQIVWSRQKSLSVKNEFELVHGGNELFQAGSMGKHLRLRGEQGETAYGRQMASVCSGLNRVTLVGLHHPGLCRPTGVRWDFIRLPWKVIEVLKR